MATIGFHASHEQLAPSTLLAAVESFREAGGGAKPDLGEITAALQGIVDLGGDGLTLHHGGQEQGHFIDAFGAKMLPELGS